VAQIICVLGNKGGTGKTTLSHMIAHGMALLGKRVVCVLTDLEREKLQKEGRKYLPFDARETANLSKLMTTLNNVPDWFGVIDGGGNRSDFDSYLANQADLVLLPFRDSHEDMRTVVRDLEWMPRAWGLPTQWPVTEQGRAVSNASMERMMPGFTHRVLDPIPFLPISKLLLQAKVPEQLPPQLNSVCRVLAMEILEKLDIEFESELDPAELSQMTPENREQITEALSLDSSDSTGPVPA